MSQSETFAKNLERMRRERKASYGEFSEELGIGKSTLFGITHETEVPRFSTIMHIAEQLKLPLSELFASPEDLLEEIASEAKRKIHPLLIPIARSFIEELLKLSDELFQRDESLKKD